MSWFNDFGVRACLPLAGPPAEGTSMRMLTSPIVALAHLFPQIRLPLTGRLCQTYDISLDSPWVEQNQTSFNVDTKRSRLQNCILLQVKLKCEGMIFT